MKKYLFLLVCCIGCASNPSSAPISDPSPSPAPVAIPPSVDKPVFYQGYAVLSKFDEATHTFRRIGTDSIPAQIRAGVKDGEIKATVSINDENHPVDVFLFSKGDYYLGNDKTSYAYFSKDYTTIIWGTASEEEPGVYKTVYASR